MMVLEQRPSHVPLVKACDVLGLNRSTVYSRRRHRKALSDPARRSRKHARQPRALSRSEREAIREVANQPHYWDQTPYQIFHRELEQGRYRASLRTIYRVLAEVHQSGERRDQRPPQTHVTPRLSARLPNEVWSWDITKLPTMRRGTYLNLYVVMDLKGRYVVAWMISRKENSALAQQLIREAMDRHGIGEDSLTVHQDRGAPMIAHSFLDMLAELGATASHSRPRVSNDNPFSESQFKTLKQQPDYPGRFIDIHHARQWCQAYFDWYNNEHHHSGLGGFTPRQVYTGEYRTVAKERQRAMDHYYAQHPERFVHGRPRVAMPPEVVHINRVDPESDEPASTAVNFPTLPAARKAREENRH